MCIILSDLDLTFDLAVVILTFEITMGFILQTVRFTRLIFGEVIG